MCDTNVNLILVSGVIRVYFVIRPTDRRECQQCSDFQTARTHESVASRHLAVARGRARGRERRNVEMKGKKREEKKEAGEAPSRKREREEKNAPARGRARARASTCA